MFTLYTTIIGLAMKLSAFILTITVVLSQSSAQDFKLPVLSPTAVVSQDVSTSKIEIAYSRPSARGRKIFGDVVPFGTVWRTGANAATKVTLGEDAMIGGVLVRAGAYSLYSIPNAQEWEIILNRNTGNWGANGYDTKDDVVRTRVASLSLPNAVETFTISIGNITFSSCSIDLAWENTMISIPVTFPNQERLLTSIDKAINSPTIPYQPAASYLFETNQQLDKALEYATKAAEKNPKAYWIQMLRARIAAKLNQADIARDAARNTIELAKGTSGEAEYTKSATDLLQSIK
ncbi:MAG: DUF2911 domain-containing protein [Ignavibacteria bacterium]|nr:DUF2911 domain-containing protein [Ignavibacteria bacterium]